MGIGDWGGGRERVKIREMGKRESEIMKEHKSNFCHHQVCNQEIMNVDSRGKERH